MDYKSIDPMPNERKNIDLRALARAYSASHEGFMVTGKAQNIILINKAFTAITGYSEEECYGRDCHFLNGSHTDLEIIKQVDEGFHNVTPFFGEIRFRRKDGSYFWAALSINPLFDEAGNIKAMVWLINDVSKRKDLEKQLKALAFTDSLTQLFTRRVLEDRLGQVILKSSRNKQYAALFFIDLDHFKRINDIFGHKAGDIRLKDVAKRLKECVREEDTVARVGGDEFVILINELNPDISIAKQGVIKVAEKIVEQLSTKSCLKDPIPKSCQLDDISQCQCSASVGVVLFSGKDRSVAQLLDQADQEMYRAKKAGGNRYLLIEADTASNEKSSGIAPLDLNNKTET